MLCLIIYNTYNFIEWGVVVHHRQGDEEIDLENEIVTETDDEDGREREDEGRTERKSNSRLIYHMYNICFKTLKFLCRSVERDRVKSRDRDRERDRERERHRRSYSRSRSRERDRSKHRSKAKPSTNERPIITGIIFLKIQWICKLKRLI